MDPQRWQEIERLYHAAQKYAEDDRAAFLENACAGDKSLRREVESLLACRHEANDFIESPAVHFTSNASVQAQIPSPDLTGQDVLHFRILGKIGAGGMGDVYRARDDLLKRDVAIKVLPDIFTDDPERLVRFEREARLLASLNHPNIAAIYSIEKIEVRRFLVLELVEGETLAQRIARGRLPLADALEICRQIAEGLEAAHDKGVVHRDLKPANVMVTPQGKVKVLDFGLAKPPSLEGSAGDLGNSPNPAEAGTHPGVILGTAAYMSPEQANGKPTDKRTDIWAFGCVLYECLAGKRAFPGETVTEIIASILKNEPDWTMLAADTPPSVRAVLRRCLQKDAAVRFHDIADARIELNAPYLEPTEAVRRKSSRLLQWGGCVLAALAVAGLALTLVLGYRSGDEVVVAVVPFENSTPGNSTLGDSIAEKLNLAIGELGIIKVRPLLDRQILTGDLNSQALANRLGVAALIWYRMRQEGENLEIYVELVDGRDGHASPFFRSESFSHTTALVAEIARWVVEGLRSQLGPAELKLLESLAYYGKGRDELDSRNSESIKNAEQYFNLASKLNPRYAPAFAGLAETYDMMAIYGGGDPREVFPKALKAAEDALNIDGKLPQAHSSLGYALERYALSRQAAEREYELAIKYGAANPDALANAYQRYGAHLVGLRRFREGIDYLHRAQNLNPLAPIAMVDEAQALIYMGNLQEAIRLCERTLARFPTFAPAYRFRGIAYELRGEYAKAIDDLESAVDCSGNSPLMKGELGHVLASAGRRDKAQDILSELLQRKKSGYSSSFRIAQIYVCLGDEKTALEYLVLAFEERDPYLWFLAVDPILNGKLGDNPRFIDLKKRAIRP